MQHSSYNLGNFLSYDETIEMTTCLVFKYSLSFYAKDSGNEIHLPIMFEKYHLIDLIVKFASVFVHYCDVHQHYFIFNKQLYVEFIFLIFCIKIKSTSNSNAMVSMWKLTDIFFLISILFLYHDISYHPAIKCSHCFLFTRKKRQ